MTVSLLGNSNRKVRLILKKVIIYFNCCFIFFTVLIIFLNNFSLALVSVSSEYEYLVYNCDNSLYGVIVRFVLRIQDSVLGLLYLKD